MSKILQYEPFQSAVDATFWHTLGSNKINLYKLDDASVPIQGFYSSGGAYYHINSSHSDALPSRLCVSSTSFSKIQRQPDSRSCIVPGVLKNTNTIEDFKSVDKNSLIKTVSLEIWQDILSGAAVADPTLLNKFLLLTFADLKKYKFYYWFAFPALLPTEPIVLDGPARSLVESYGSEMAKNPGWPLRNFLALVSYRWKLSKVTVVCYRESSKRRDDISASIVLDVTLTTFPDEPKCAGWEKGINGKPMPRVADLAALMDPSRLAETAVDLNLKLMRWRILPELNLEAISQKKCLLLGAGTLGCYVARLLLAWGVRNITLVDNGKISFSNPVRQPLFKFNDCLDGGGSKAIMAAAALKEIFPGVNSVGVELSIPMPGHSIQTAHAITKDIKKLEELVQSHDAIFLLTDSREGRWLPTLLGASMGKSLTDRTLDQQCTVTRPGLSSIASALAVELLSSISNHPHGPWANATNQPSDPGASILGAMPHQIRGHLGQFNNILVVGHAYDKCPACSKSILDEYAKNGHSFLLKGLASPEYLEEVSGLKDLKHEHVDIEWDDDEGSLDM
ncbi:E1-like protein-activating enzyme Gsa7p/Apg7p [Batrachochytrium dendrobatidis JEL423]|uniref:Ubiquitin-like modifier-activating enzyme ATG7 n=1 Tax=Batrachochytrium dendrobatidis (strain JEL423) TaxID=403673 RepID=A0A177WIG0_BATDL|nr:E1-like protein-activating enzyme Gsa7p/Apg7p [Batrachochytrium dendrobatidis JEL423]